MHGIVLVKSTTGHADLKIYARPWYFFLGAGLSQKKTLVQNSHLQYHMVTSKLKGHSYYCLSTVFYLDNNNCSPFFLGHCVNSEVIV